MTETYIHLCSVRNSSVTLQRLIAFSHVGPCLYLLKTGKLIMVFKSSQREILNHKAHRVSRMKSRKTVIK